MATVGAKLTIPFTVGAAQIVGQGSAPELWCLYTTSDASVASPLWIDATADVRSFSSSRGRETELASIEAGIATITLDNRDRTFDPTLHSEIHPLNRWWLREQFAGETQDIYLGYAESYQQEWPPPSISDALCTVTCSDEFKLLSLDALPTTSPPRASYDEVIQSDNPAGYWPMNVDPEFQIQEAQIPVAEPTPTPTTPPPPTGPILHPGLVGGDDWGWGW